jgi:hypothetical protein
LIEQDRVASAEQGRATLPALRAAEGGLACGFRQADVRKGDSIHPQSSLAERAWEMRKRNAGLFCQRQSSSTATRGLQQNLNQWTGV